jgi:hypothetical protein
MRCYFKLDLTKNSADRKMDRSNNCCSNCTFLSQQIEYLRQELFNARLTISKQEGVISVLKSVSGNGFSSDAITHEFLSKVAEEKFTVGIFTSGIKSYATYILDNIVPGRVVCANKQKRTVRYVTEGNNVIEEAVGEFVTKVLLSTQFKANKLYQTAKEICISEFCGDDNKADAYAASTTEISKRFANMALIRSCNNDFCKEVAGILFRNLCF